jgi:phosphatidylinositol alpha-1,6-mannosyltransferase
VQNSGLQNHVFFLGRVSEEEKDRLYRECDYFIMPSYMKENTGDFEGFGIVYIEASMYGKFVIATRSGGIPDAVCEGVTGAFVEAQDSESVYLKLKELYSNDFYPDRLKCIEWSKKMDTNNIVRQYIDAISDVIK